MMTTTHVRSTVAVATGLAVAVIAISTFQSWRADAAPGDDDATFVPTTPCRLADTRPAPDRVGTAGAFSSDDTKIFPAHGTNGDCTIPNDAVGLSLNVTALDATAPTFLTVWPDGDLPEASSLNPVPDQPPVPNAVTTTLSETGSFNVYNLAGSLDVIIDVNGYYTNSTLQEIASRLAAAEATIVQLEASVSDLELARPFTVTNTEFTDLGNTPLVTPLSFVSVPLTAPTDGQVTVHSTAHVSAFNSNAELNCAIVETADIPEVNISRATPSYQRWKALNSSNEDTISASRVFDIESDETVSYSLACEVAVDGAIINVRSLTATFTPAP